MTAGKECFFEGYEFPKGGEAADLMTPYGKGTPVLTNQPECVNFARSF